MDATLARRIGFGASGSSHSRSESGSHVCSVRWRLRRARNTTRVLRRLVLVAFPFRLRCTMVSVTKKYAGFITRGLFPIVPIPAYTDALGRRVGC